MQGRSTAESAKRNSLSEPVELLDPVAHRGDVHIQQRRNLGRRQAAQPTRPGRIGISRTLFENLWASDCLALHVAHAESRRTTRFVRITATINAFRTERAAARHWHRLALGQS